MRIKRPNCKTNYRRTGTWRGWRASAAGAVITLTTRWLCGRGLQAKPARDLRGALAQKQQQVQNILPGVLAAYPVGRTDGARMTTSRATIRSAVAGLLTSGLGLPSGNVMEFLPGAFRGATPVVLVLSGGGREPIAYALRNTAGVFWTSKPMC